MSFSSLRINCFPWVDVVLGLFELAERRLVVVVHHGYVFCRDAPERVGHTGGDGRLVLVLGPEGERPGRVGFGLGVAPGCVHDVALELVRAAVVGDLHELLGGEFESTSSDLVLV